MDWWDNLKSKFTEFIGVGSKRRRDDANSDQQNPIDLNNYEVYDYLDDDGVSAKKRKTSSVGRYSGYSVMANKDNASWPKQNGSLVGRSSYYPGTSNANRLRRENDIHGDYFARQMRRDITHQSTNNQTFRSQYSSASKAPDIGRICAGISATASDKSLPATSSFAVPSSMSTFGFSLLTKPRNDVSAPKDENDVKYIGQKVVNRKPLPSQVLQNANNKPDPSISSQWKYANFSEYVKDKPRSTHELLAKELGKDLSHQRTAALSSREPLSTFSRSTLPSPPSSTLAARTPSRFASQVHNEVHHRHSRKKSPEIIDLTSDDDADLLPVETGSRQALTPYLSHTSPERRRRDQQLRKIATSSPRRENLQRQEEQEELRKLIYYGLEHPHLISEKQTADLLKRNDLQNKIAKRVKEIESSNFGIDLQPLNSDENEAVEKAFRNGPPMEKMFAKPNFAYDILRKDIQTLKGLTWLNDEVCNMYLELIVDRSKRLPDLYPKVFAFNTFFYSQLLNKGYTSLRRWTKKVDIFSYKIIIVPVHLGNHWCLSVIDLEQKKMRYYDSLGGSNPQCFAALKSYLEEEKKDKQSGFELDWEDWEFVCEDNIPHQANGSDCGVFMLKFADFLSRRKPLDFDQKDMPYFRRRICWEILQQKLMGT